MKRRDIDFSSLGWLLKYEAACQILALDEPPEMAVANRRTIALHPAVGRRLCLAAWKIILSSTAPCGVRYIGRGR